MSFALGGDGCRQRYAAANAERHIAYMCLPYHSTLDHEGVVVDLSARWDIVDALAARRVGGVADSLVEKLLDGRIRYHYSREVFLEHESWCVVSRAALQACLDMRTHTDVCFRSMSAEIRKLRTRLASAESEHERALEVKDAYTRQDATNRAELSRVQQARDELKLEVARLIAVEAARSVEACPSRHSTHTQTSACQASYASGGPNYGPSAHSHTLSQPAELHLTRAERDKVLESTRALEEEAQRQAQTLAEKDSALKGALARASDLELTAHAMSTIINSLQRAISSHKRWHLFTVCFIVVMVVKIWLGAGTSRIAPRNTPASVGFTTSPDGAQFLMSRKHQSCCADCQESELGSPMRDPVPTSHEATISASIPTRADLKSVRVAENASLYDTPAGEPDYSNDASVYEAATRVGINTRDANALRHWTGAKRTTTGALGIFVGLLRADIATLLPNWPRGARSKFCMVIAPIIWWPSWASFISGLVCLFAHHAPFWLAGVLACLAPVALRGVWQTLTREHGVLHRMGY
jgi:hypothetical protein